MQHIPSSLPAPRTLDPMAAPTLRWGVMGTGWIASRFVQSVQRHTRQQFAAIASRDQDRAAEAGRRLRIPRAYGSYAELAADPDVDVVYVATGHAGHVPCARIAVEHGKHTLVEKPLALNAGAAAELAGLAKARGVFLAEALWSFFLPRYDVVRQILEFGVLGEIRTVMADHGEHFVPGHRILRADQLGGPMNDLGPYPASFATWVLGEPDSVVASSRPHPAGVIGQVGAVLTAGPAAQALLHATVFGDTPTTATICGSDATLTMPGPFYQPGDVVLRQAGGGAVATWTEPAIAHEALFYEAAETARCIAAGQSETSLRTMDSTIATLRTMDAIRAACGIVHPGD